MTTEQEAIDAAYIPGQEIHRPSRNRGQTPTFIPFDDSYVGRGRIGNTLEFIPGDEPNVNSAYAAGYMQPMTHDEKARAFFTQQHTPGQLEGLKQLADSLVIAARPEPIEIKASFTLDSPEIELDADGNPTTLESAMALDAVDALCAAEDEAWKKEIEEMEFDFSKESIVEMLNEELVAEGRDPFYSVQMLSAQASAALRKKQKARKKKRK